MKTLIFILLSILVCAGIASAGLMPMVIYGEVSFDGKKYSNQEVLVTDTDLGASWTVKTNENGVFQIVFNNLQSPNGKSPREGDTIVLNACVNKDKGCEKTVTLSETPQKVNFGITGMNLSEVLSVGAMLVGALLVSVAVFRWRKKRSGVLEGIHKHEGIKGEHSVNVLHEVARLRHPKGMQNPQYEKRSDGLWYYKP